MKNDVAPAPQHSKWYLLVGFFFGFLVYPLLTPWVIFGLPPEITEAYITLYAKYVFFVLEATG
jgi:hypothetical protein